MELAAMLAGVAEREEKHNELVAWQVMHTVNISGKSVKKNVTVNSLLGRNTQAFPMSDEDVIKELKRRQAMIDAKKKATDGN